MFPSEQFVKTLKAFSERTSFKSVEQLYADKLYLNKDADKLRLNLYLFSCE